MNAQLSPTHATEPVSQPSGGRPRWPKLTAKIKAALEHGSTARCAVSYLPWTGTPEEIKADVEQLASDVEVLLLDAPPVTEGDGAATYLAHLIEELAQRAAELGKSEQLKETKEALETLSPSPALLKCAQARLHPVLVGERFMVAALSSSPETSRWLSWLLEALRGMHVRSVVVVGATPTSDAEVIRLTLQEMYEDLLGKAQESVSQGKASNPSPNGDRETSKPSWLRRWPKRRKKNKSNTSKAERPSETLPYADWANLFAPERRNDQDEWACWQRTIIRLAHPNLSLANKLIHRLLPEVEKTVARLTNKGSRGGGDETPMHLREPSSEEARDLLNRLRFIATVGGFYPNLIIPALRHELDAADQFYRLLLILGGWTAQDSLLANALLPQWRKYLDDYVFCELVRSMFRVEDGCGVKRFESRSQLFWLACWNPSSEAANNPGESPAQKWMDSFTDWVARIGQHSGGKPEDQQWLADQLIKSDFPSDDLQLPNHGGQNAAELLQIAQMLLSADELVGRTGNSKDIEYLIAEAINSSRGAIHVDATLIKARALVVRDDSERADRTRAKALLREVRRHADLLARIAVDVEEAFMFERRGDYWEAIRRYEKALKDAELVAADELCSRAMLGWLRCDTLTSATPSRRSPAATLGLRARCMVQIQAARAPDLFPGIGIGNDNPRLFLSYRSDTKEFSKKLYQKLAPKLDPKLEPLHVPLVPWRDDEALDKTDKDFGATIHRELLGCNAIVLALCPTFFESPWCVHELHFALGQHEVRGIHLFWTWCTDGKDSFLAVEDSPMKAARRWIDRPEDELAAYGQSDYHRFHERERILRVIEHGECLTDRVVRQDSLDETVTDAAITLYRAIPHIRKQAGLEPISAPQGRWESILDS